MHNTIEVIPETVFSLVFARLQTAVESGRLMVWTLDQLPATSLWQQSFSWRGRSKLEAHAEHMLPNEVTLIVFHQLHLHLHPLIVKTGRFGVLEGHVLPKQIPPVEMQRRGLEARRSWCVIDTGAMTQSQPDVCCHGSPTKPRRCEPGKYFTF